MKSLFDNQLKWIDNLPLNFASSMTYGLNKSPAKRHLIPSTNVLTSVLGILIASNPFLSAFILILFWRSIFTCCPIIKLLFEYWYDLYQMDRRGRWLLYLFKVSFHSSLGWTCWLGFTHFDGSNPILLSIKC